MSYLIYVNGLGPDYKGDNLYEFIFSQDLDDIWGPSWDSMPSNGYPSPPDLKHIIKVGVLRKTEIEFELIQKSLEQLESQRKHISANSECDERS